MWRIQPPSKQEPLLNDSWLLPCGDTGPGFPDVNLIQIFMRTLLIFLLATIPFSKTGSYNTHACKMITVASCWAACSALNEAVLAEGGPITEAMLPLCASSIPRNTSIGALSPRVLFFFSKSSSKEEGCFFHWIFRARVEEMGRRKEKRGREEEKRRKENNISVGETH